MIELWFKWTVLVWANAIVGLRFADIGQDWAYSVGVVLGVCVFIPIYVLIDNDAIKNNDLALQKSLLIGVIIRAITQCILVVDIVAGLIGGGIVQSLFGLLWHDGGFWVGFLMTVATGSVLSVFVGVLVFLIMLIRGVLGK